MSAPLAPEPDPLAVLRRARTRASGHGQTLTQLQPAEEQQFQSWYKGWSDSLGLDPDPDNPLHYYDYRGAWKAGAEPKVIPEDGLPHWPSEFKLEGHPNLIVNGMDTRTGTPVAKAGAAGPQNPIAVLQRATERALGGVEREAEGALPRFHGREALGRAIAPVSPTLTGAGRDPRTGEPLQPQEIIDQIVQGNDPLVRGPGRNIRAASDVTAAPVPRGAVPPQRAMGRTPERVRGAPEPITWEEANREARALESNPVRAAVRGVGRDAGARFALQMALKIADKAGLQTHPLLQKIVDVANRQAEAEAAGNPELAARLTRDLSALVAEFEMIPGGSIAGSVERVAATGARRVLAEEFGHALATRGVAEGIAGRMARRAAEDAARFGLVEGVVGVAQEPNLEAAAARQRAGFMAGAVLGPVFQGAGEFLRSLELLRMSHETGLMAPPEIARTADTAWRQATKSGKISLEEQQGYARQILGLDESATEHDISTALRDRVVRRNPDGTLENLANTDPELFKVYSEAAATLRRTVRPQVSADVAEAAARPAAAEAPRATAEPRPPEGPTTGTRGTTAGEPRPEPKPADVAARAQQQAAGGNGRRPNGIRRRIAEIVDPSIRREMEEAYVDPMTGLGNQTAFQQARSRLDDDPSYHVASFDITNLKAINDTPGFGRSTADARIGEVAAVIREEAEARGIPARDVQRAGGDEIAVWGQDPAVLQEVVDAAKARLEPMQVGPYSSHLRGAVGSNWYEAEKATQEAKKAETGPRARGGSGPTAPQPTAAGATGPATGKTGFVRDDSGAVYRVVDASDPALLKVQPISGGGARPIGRARLVDLPKAEAAPEEPATPPEVGTKPAGSGLLETFAVPIDQLGHLSDERLAAMREQAQLAAEDDERAGRDLELLEEERARRAGAIREPGPSGRAAPDEIEAVTRQLQQAPLGQVEVDPDTRFSIRFSGEKGTEILDTSHPDQPVVGGFVEDPNADKAAAAIDAAFTETEGVEEPQGEVTPAPAQTWSAGAGEGAYGRITEALANLSELSDDELKKLQDELMEHYGRFANVAATSRKGADIRAAMGPWKVVVEGLDRVKEEMDRRFVASGKAKPELGTKQPAAKPAEPVPEQGRTLTLGEMSDDQLLTAYAEADEAQDLERMEEIDRVIEGRAIIRARDVVNSRKGKIEELLAAAEAAPTLQATTDLFDAAHDELQTLRDLASDEDKYDFETLSNLTGVYDSRLTALSKKMDSLIEFTPEAVDEALERAVGGGPEMERMQAEGATNPEIRAFLKERWGLHSSHGAAGEIRTTRQGTGTPQVEFSRGALEKPEVVLRGKELVERVRQVKKIPQPGEQWPEDEAGEETPDLEAMSSKELAEAYDVAEEGGDDALADRIADEIDRRQPRTQEEARRDARRQEKDRALAERDRPPAEWTQEELDRAFYAVNSGHWWGETLRALRDGATDEEIVKALDHMWGHGTGQSAPGGITVSSKGGKNPVFSFGEHWPSTGKQKLPEGAIQFKGKKLLDMVRRTFRIPKPGEPRPEIPAAEEGAGFDEDTNLGLQYAADDVAGWEKEYWELKRRAWDGDQGVLARMGELKKIIEDRYTEFGDVFPPEAMERAVADLHAGRKLPENMAEYLEGPEEPDLFRPSATEGAKEQLPPEEYDADYETVANEIAGMEFGRRTIRQGLEEGKNVNTGRPLTPKQKREYEHTIADLDKKIEGFYSEFEARFGEEQTAELRRRVAGELEPAEAEEAPAPPKVTPQVPNEPGVRYGLPSFIGKPHAGSAAPEQKPDRERNLDRLMGAYEQGLRKAIERRPDEYGYGQDEVPGVLEKMRAAIDRGSYNMSAAIRAAARSVGAKPTFKGIEEFLAGPASDEPPAGAAAAAPKPPKPPKQGDERSMAAEWYNAMNPAARAVIVNGEEEYKRSNQIRKRTLEENAKDFRHMGIARDRIVSEYRRLHQGETKPAAKPKIPKDAEPITSVSDLYDDDLLVDTRSGQHYLVRGGPNVNGIGLVKSTPDGKPGLSIDDHPAEEVTEHFKRLRRATRPWEEGEAPAEEPEVEEAEPQTAEAQGFKVGGWIESAPRSEKAEAPQEPAAEPTTFGELPDRATFRFPNLDTVYRREGRFYRPVDGGKRLTGSDESEVLPVEAAPAEPEQTTEAAPSAELRAEDQEIIDARDWWIEQHGKEAWTNAGRGERQKIIAQYRRQAASATEPEVKVQRSLEQEGAAASPEDLEKLTRAATVAIEDGTLPKGSRELRQWAADVLGRPYESGTWSTDDMYDAIEGGLNRFLLQWPSTVDAGPNGIVPLLKEVKEVEERFLGNRLRSTSMIERQQYSTPTVLSYAAAWALQPVPNDKVLEPSAGTGNLVTPLVNAERPVEIHANEIDKRRAEVLRMVLGEDAVVTQEDALRLPLTGERFNGLITNPPFGGRNLKKYSGFGATDFEASDISQRFVAQALQMLVPGSRLVTIMPRGTTNQSARPFRDWLRENYVLTALIESPEGAYDLRGTKFGTVMLVVDVPHPEMKQYPAALDVRDPTWDEWYHYIKELGPGGSHARLAPHIKPENVAPTALPEQKGPKKEAALIDRSAGTSDISTEAGETSPQQAIADALRTAAEAIEEASRGSTEAGPRAAGAPVDEGVGAEAPGARGGAGPRPEQRAPESGVGPVAGEERGSGVVAGQPSGKAARVEPAGEGEVVPRVARRRIEAHPDDTAERRREIAEANDSEVFTPYARGLGGRYDERRSPHPRLVVETRSMAGMDAPPITAQFKSPIVEDAWGRDGAKGGLSDDQAEGVLRGLTAWDNGHGFLAADDVGVGKTREAAALTLESIADGVTRLLYTTKNEANVIGAMEEFKRVASGDPDGDFPATIVFLADYKKVKSGEESLPQPDGPVLYVGHSYNVAAYREALLEVGIQTWIADEAHEFKNVMSSARGEAWTTLHKDILARGGKIAYFTATPAVTLDELAYLYGLKEWAPGGFEDWVDRKLGRAAVSNAEEADVDAQIQAQEQVRLEALQQAGEIDQAATKGKKKFMRGKDVFKATVTPAETEQVMRELKGKGKYISRDLWRGGVTFDVEEVDILGDTEEARAGRQRYDIAAQLVRDITRAARKFGAMNKQKRTTGLERSQIQAYMKQLLFDLRLPRVLELADEALARGQQVVISTHSVAGDPVPEEGVTAAEAKIPVNKRLESAINAINTREVEKEGTGDEAEFVDLGDIPEALAVRAELLDRLASLKPLSDPVKRIEEHFGAQNVATITGQKTAKQRAKSMREFQIGKRTVALISKAGKIGIDLHDVNGKQRRMIVADYEWSADTFKQELGRVDRTGQKSSPHITLVASTMAGERKFAATIAARMASLGATSKGAAESTGTDALDQFDLSGDFAAAAMRNAVEMLDDDVKQHFTSTKLTERDHRTGEVRPMRRPTTEAGVRDFLLDLLMFPVEAQQKAYQAFMQERDHLMSGEAAEASAARRTGKRQGHVLRTTQLAKEPPLTLYEIETVDGEHYGIVQGFVTEYIHDLQTARGTTKYGDRKSRHYVQFTDTEHGELVSGLEVNRAEGNRIKVLFGVAGRTRITPRDVWDDLQAGDNVKVHGAENKEWILHPRRDGRIQIQGATLSKHQAVLKGLAKYEPVGNLLFIPQEEEALLKFLERFPPVQPKLNVDSTNETLLRRIHELATKRGTRNVIGEAMRESIADKLVRRESYNMRDYYKVRYLELTDAALLAKALEEGALDKETLAALKRRFGATEEAGEDIQELRIEDEAIDAPAMEPSDDDVTDLGDVLLEKPMPAPVGVNMPESRYGVDLFELARQIDTPARYKHLTASLGRFVPKSERIEVQDVTNLFQLAHEIGHAVDYRLSGDRYPSSIAERFGSDVPAGITEQALRVELLEVAQLMRPVKGGANKLSKYRRRHTELMSDFYALYLLDPETAGKVAPNVTEAFLASLKRQPKLHDAIRETLAARRRYRPSDTVPEIRPVPEPTGLIPEDVKGGYTEAVAALVKNVPRTYHLMKDRARHMADQWRKITKEEEREDIGAAVEGIGNLRTGKSAKDVAAGLTPVQKRILKEYRLEQERARQVLNEFMRDVRGDDYVNYLEDYLLHFYVRDPKRMRKFAVRWAKNVPSSKARRLPTLQDAVQAGLTPVTQDVAALHQLWAEINWRGAINQRFVFELKQVVNADGLPVLLKPNQAPPDWPVVDHPAIQKIYARKLANGRVELWHGGAAVDPEVYRMTRQIFERPFTGKFVRAVETFNAFAKWAALSLSLFHHWALTESANAALARVWNPVRGLTLVGTGLRGGVPLGFGARITQPHREGLRLLELPEVRRDLVMHGLNIDPSPDVMIGRVNRAMMEAEARIRRNPVLGKIPGLERLVRSVRQFKNWFDIGLWNRYYTGLKAYTYYDLVREQMANMPDDADPDDIRRVKEKIAELVNDMFGGQEWEGKFWMTPKGRQLAHLVLLAPDWTLSNINVAVKSAFQAKDPVARKALWRYWRNMLLGFFAFVGTANYVLNRRWPWQNEPGHKLDIDITPIVRRLPWTSEEDKKSGRHWYIGPGKQFREVVRYLTDPVSILGAKLSPAMHVAFEQVTGHQPGQNGWDMPWARDELTWYESLPSRMVAVMDKFTPFAVRGNNFAFTFPLSRGMSWYKAQRAYEHIIQAQVDPSLYHRLMPGRDAETLKAEIDNAAALNGLDAAELYKEANTMVRSRYYGDFWRALDKEDLHEAERIATVLNKLGATRESLQSSGERRGVEPTDLQRGGAYLPSGRPPPNAPRPPRPPQPPRPGR